MVAEPASSVPVVISLALTAAFLWAVSRIMMRRRGKRPVADAAHGEPYRIYTREYDRVLTTADLPATLYDASPDREMGYVEADDRKWRTQIANAEYIYRGLDAPSPLAGSEAGQLHNAAVLLMIDQSGSMRGEPMAWVAAGTRRLSQELERRGASVAVAGYTTAGWHGGFARRKWLRESRPRRPGRLCALLHILYQPFDSSGLDDNV
jgi:cobaltochelatase CobT